MADLETLHNQYNYTHRYLGGSSEFDTSINHISRAKIKAFKKEKGSCFCYKINLYCEHPICEEYTGQKVYNFEYDFCLAEKDSIIIEMIKKHNTPKDKLDNTKTCDLIGKIFNRIDELKGALLAWS